MAKQQCLPRFLGSVIVVVTLTATTSAKTLEFPPDRAVGVVQSRPIKERENYSWYDDWAAVGVARGLLEVPNDHEVRLNVSREGAKNLDFLSQLPQDPRFSI